MAWGNLQIGDKVEISRDNLNDRGALFPATITAINPNSITVEYDFLEDEEHRYVRLRENVCFEQIRPEQPQETDYNFKRGERVDLFVHGGWREGRVTRVLTRSSYLVFFKFSKQQLSPIPKFRMRLHHQWVKEGYSCNLQPLSDEEEEVSSNQVGKTEKFHKGMLVEVTSDEEGLEGSWYSATIVKALRKDRFLIQYHSLKTEDYSEFLKEEVDARHIRAVPSVAKVINGFTVNEEVDALYNDGWWEGVVSKVLQGSRYTVYFRGTGDEMMFHQNELRPRQ